MSELIDECLLLAQNRHSILFKLGIKITSQPIAFLLQAQLAGLFMA